MNDWKQLTESEGLHTFCWFEGRLYKNLSSGPITLLETHLLLFPFPSPISFHGQPNPVAHTHLFLLKTALTPRWQRLTLYLESFFFNVLLCVDSSIKWVGFYPIRECNVWKSDEKHDMCKQT